MYVYTRKDTHANMTHKYIAHTSDKNTSHIQATKIHRTYKRHTNAYLYIYIHVHTYIYIYIYIHIYIYIYIYIYLYIYVYIYE